MKAKIFGKSGMYRLSFLGIRFKGNATKSTRLVIRSCWSFAKVIHEKEKLFSSLIVQGPTSIKLLRVFFAT